jgi:Cu/Ag efflux pump CusA
MNRTQKIARFSLIVILIALTLSVIAVGVLYFVVGLPIRRALGGFGFIAICGLTGLAPLLYKKERGKVSFDERDLLIQKKASLRAYTIFWVLFVLAAMIPFFVLGPDGAVSVKYLAAMVFGGMVTVMLVQSIVTLEEYGWRDRGEK